MNNIYNRYICNICQKEYLTLIYQEPKVCPHCCSVTEVQIKPVGQSRLVSYNHKVFDDKSDFEVFINGKSVAEYPGAIVFKQKIIKPPKNFISKFFFWLQGIYYDYKLRKAIGKIKVQVQGITVDKCPRVDCKHHPINGGNHKYGCIVGEWGNYKSLNREVKSKL